MGKGALAAVFSLYFISQNYVPEPLLDAKEIRGEVFGFPAFILFFNFLKVGGEGEGEIENLKQTPHPAQSSISQP